MLVLEEIKQTQQKISELNDQKENIRKNGVDNTFWEDAEAGAANMLNGFKQSLGLMSDEWANNVLNKYINKGADELRTIDKEILTLNEHLEESRQKLIAIEVSGNKADGNGGDGGNGDDDKDKKPWVTRLKNAENAYKDELLLLRKNRMNLVERRMSINRMLFRRKWNTKLKDWLSLKSINR